MRRDERGRVGSPLFSLSHTRFSPHAHHRSVANVIFGGYATAAKSSSASAEEGPAPVTTDAASTVDALLAAKEVREG